MSKSKEAWSIGGMDYCPECGATGDYEALRKKCSHLESDVFQLRDALTQMLRMPEYDGTQNTSRERLMIKNAARRALRDTASTTTTKEQA